MAPTRKTRQRCRATSTSAFFVFLCYVARTKTGLSPGSGKMSPLPPLTRKGENMEPQSVHVPSAAALLSNVRLGKTATHNRILERLYGAAEVSLSPQKTQAARFARREKFNSGQRIEPRQPSENRAASLSEAGNGKHQLPAGNPGTMKPWSICAPRGQHTPGRPLALGTPSCSVAVYVLLTSLEAVDFPGKKPD